MFAGIVAAVGRIASIAPLGSSADAGGRLSVDAGSPGPLPAVSFPSHPPTPQARTSGRC